MTNRVARWWMIACLGIIGLASLNACSLSGLVDVDDPEAGREIDHDVLRSYSGALNIYYAAVSSLAQSMSLTSRSVGVFTDELLLVKSGGSGDYALDARHEEIGANGQPRLVGTMYQFINSARIRAMQAQTLFREYGPPASVPLLSHAYAIEGFSILILAELYCSGIPLTEVPFEGEIRYTRGYSTEELFEHAIAKFDTALQFEHDSLPIFTLARVGKGRALLGLGRYDEAAQAVKEVATSDRYLLEYANYPSTEYNGEFWTVSDATQRLMVVNFEGTSGLRWLADQAANQDPRVPVSVKTQGGTLAYVSPTRQEKFVGGTLDVALVDGIQARMIEAEAQLNNIATEGDAWLQTINALRHMRDIADTTDPGTELGRVNLLFRERAYWFYLLGTRLGDLRRLIRQYGRATYQVYPSGVYPNGNSRIPFYGEAYVFSPPDAEYQHNYLYSGCINRNP